MKNLLIVSCKEATLLICKREEQELTGNDRFKLKLHLFICHACKLFSRQNDFINDSLKTKRSEHNVSMPAAKKEEIKKLLIKEED